MVFCQLPHLSPVKVLSVYDNEKLISRIFPLPINLRVFSRSEFSIFKFVYFKFSGRNQNSDYKFLDMDKDMKIKMSFILVKEKGLALYL